MVLRHVSNLGWKVMVFGSVIYGCIQLCSYVADNYRSHVKAESHTPVVETLDDTVRRAGEGIQWAGGKVSGSVERCRPYLDNAERYFQNDTEKAQE